jgi:DNA-binding NtrC family response regulator
MGSARLLIVDDEPQLRDLLRRYLERAGFQVDVCAAPEEAIQLFNSDPERYSLVITDLTLQNMNGEEMIEQMRLKHPGIRAIIASGYPYEPRGERIAFLQKPFLPQMLVEAVNKVLEPE